ncbi:tellurite resistance TerB family protein [Neotabrizicola shimadae]|uniref:Tellurite resistance TerB family protein n=1 Tax=Neotabrizicola shimadae TaxID=2807096 RepID=A0A8G0ZWS9_9RHOB|nr:DUF533 domain-containing protein [Neotabrizicola shimadae]QYZ71643.1 tellurite resistance TerB family protein [Neotabrizicola shimadae]
MADMKSLLDSLLKGSGDLRQAGSDLGQRAKSTWDQQSTGTQGAVVGGLLGVLMGGRGGLAGLMRVGGAAVAGHVAAKAYADWKAGKDPVAGVTDALEDLRDMVMPPGVAASDDGAERMLKVVVAAAKADGHVTEAERAAIAERMRAAELDPAAQAVIQAELAAPLDLDAVAALARSEEEAVEIYTTSALLVDPNLPADRAYLEGLAARLSLDAGLVRHLDAQARKARAA